MFRFLFAKTKIRRRAVLSTHSCGNRHTVYVRIWTQSVPSMLRVLGEVEKKHTRLIHSNENLFGEFKHLKQINQQRETNI